MQKEQIGRVNMYLMIPNNEWGLHTYINISIHTNKPSQENLDKLIVYQH